VDLPNIITAGCTVIATVLSIVAILKGRFDKIDAKLESIDADIKSLDRRVSMIEGYLMGRDSRNTGCGK
jgi:hypothetical protein